jgi:TetR/AcrR family transcriptional regulator, repressor of the mexAB-oprM multidrug resistance operon
VPRNRQDIPREQRVSALLDVAVAEFLERGFDAVTMADIARRAGIRSGAVYWYFPSKDHLLAAVMDRANDARWTRLDELPAGTSAADKLVTYLADMRSMRNLHVTMHARMDAAEVVAESHRSGVERLRHLIVDALGDARGIDVDLATDAVLAAFEGANIDPHGTHSGTDIVRFLLDQILGRPAHAAPARSRAKKPPVPEART